MKAIDTVKVAAHKVRENAQTVAARYELQIIERDEVLIERAESGEFEFAAIEHIIFDVVDFFAIRG